MACFFFTGGFKVDGPFHGLGSHDFLIFPTVLVRHYQPQVFRMMLVITEFLLPFPLLHIALDNFEALWLFQVHAHGNFLTAYIEFDGLAFAYLLLGALFNVIDLFHIFELLLQLDVGYFAVDDRLGFRV